MKPFGLKSGNAYAIIRHVSNHYYVKRLHQSSRTSETIKKLKRDIKITRHNNAVYRQLNEDLMAANETNHKLINDHATVKMGLLQKNKQCYNENERCVLEIEGLKEKSKNYETQINAFNSSFENLTDQINNYKSRLSNFESIIFISPEMGIMRCNGAAACSNPSYMTALCYLTDGGPIVETTFEYWVSRIIDNYKCLPCCILGENIHPKMKQCSSMPSTSDIINQQTLHGRCGIDFNP